MRTSLVKEQTPTPSFVKDYIINQRSLLSKDKRKDVAGAVNFQETSRFSISSVPRRSSFSFPDRAVRWRMSRWRCPVDGTFRGAWKHWKSRRRASASNRSGRSIKLKLSGDRCMHGLMRLGCRRWCHAVGGGRINRKSDTGEHGIDVTETSVW